MTYYGQHEFWYFPEDDLNTKKEYFYRNTPEKIKELEEKGILKKTRRCVGGLGDTSYVEEFICDDETLKKLSEAGWSTDYEEVKHKSK